MSKYDLTQLKGTWRKALKDEFQKEYMLNLKDFLQKQTDAGKVIYPKAADIFQALNLTPLEHVKVVILGQDPYHGPGQAHGLSFSVPKELKLPPSLRNIFQELQNDLNCAAPQTGFLEPWAQQGVLLLNATLTVEKAEAGSHQKKGWEQFTDKVISVLNQREKPLAFVLWGSYAQKKGAFIDENKHLVLKAPHPSPLSAHRGFFGSKPFSTINQFLTKNQQTVINWEDL